MIGGGSITRSGQWIKLDFDIKGEKQTQRFIQNIAMRGSNFKQELTDFGMMMMSTIKKRFAAEAGRTPWQALADSTVMARTKHWGGYRAPSSQGPRHKILQWTGRLMKGYTEKNAEGNVFRVETTKLEMGTDVNYAPYHHEATRIPQRKVLFLDQRDNYHLVKLVHLSMQKKIEKARTVPSFFEGL